MSETTSFNTGIVDEFRANGGKVGGPFEHMPLLLLHHFGARSGRERVNPLAYQQVDDSFAVFASRGGAPTDPHWYANLLAHPEVSIEVGSVRQRVRARVATGAERERIWSAQKAAFPNFAEYERKTTRQIPVVLLDPA